MEEKLGTADYMVPVAVGTQTEQLSLEEMNDLIFYLLDTFSSLQMILTLHPPAAKYFHNEGFELR